MQRGARCPHSNPTLRYPSPPCASGALFAVWQGNEVLLLEKAPEHGGTTKKAAFWYWVPNNEAMQAMGIEGIPARTACATWPAEQRCAPPSPSTSSTRTGEMNQRYRSDAIVAEDQPEPRFEGPRAPLPADHLAARLQHVWHYRGPERLSSLDVTGKVRFTVLTGSREAKRSDREAPMEPWHPGYACTQRVAAGRCAVAPRVTA